MQLSWWKRNTGKLDAVIWMLEQACAARAVEGHRLDENQYWWGLCWTVMQPVAVIGFVTHDEKKGEIFATWRAPFHRVPPHQKSKPLTCEEGIYLVALHIHAILLWMIAFQQGRAWFQADKHTGCVQNWDQLEVKELSQTSRRSMFSFQGERIAK